MMQLPLWQSTLTQERNALSLRMLGAARRSPSRLDTVAAGDQRHVVYSRSYRQNRMKGHCSLTTDPE
eukprot:3227357-Rhodomonas_salina.2